MPATLVSFRGDQLVFDCVVRETLRRGVEDAFEQRDVGALGLLGVEFDDEVEVVAHDGVGVHGDGVARGEGVDALLELRLWRQ